MTRILLLFVTKEVRALLPTWLVAMGAIAAFAVSSPRAPWGELAYVLGAVTLGAQSIGHEYTNRTLTLLLSQPSTRARILLIKLGVLTAMLLALGAVAWSILSNPSDFRLGVLAVICGLFFAPLLTMLGRSALAGVVFAIVVPGSLALLAYAVSVALTGQFQSAEVDRLRLAFFWRATALACAMAAVAGWRTFMRLEAIDGSDPQIHVPQMLRSWVTPSIGAAASARARPRHPAWLLVKKELHLQQMAFVVAGIYVVMWLAISALNRIPGFVLLRTQPASTADEVLTVLYGGLLALLIGSLASAEERQIGTLEWQVLLPMATWKQWCVKAGMTLGVAMLLSLGLPVLLAAGEVSFNMWHAGAIVILTTGSLYVSSLCGSGLRALPASALAIAAVTLVFTFVPKVFVWVLLDRPFVPLASAVALALWFAHVNHRSVEHRTRQVCQQVIWMAGCLVFGVAFLALVPALR